MHDPRPARRRLGAALHGLALGAAIALAAAPAAARGPGRGAEAHGPGRWDRGRTGSLSDLSRQVIDPLVRDAARELQRTLDPEPQPASDPSPRAPAARRRVPASEPSPQPAFAPADEAAREAPPPAPAAAPAPSAAALELPTPPADAGPIASDAAIAASALALAALAFAARRWLRRPTPARVEGPDAGDPAAAAAAPALAAAPAAVEPAPASRDADVTVARSGPGAPFPAAGRYEILGEIGRGGMGVVYRARDTRLDRVVALKRLSHPLRDDPRAVALLLQEARSAARLNHPNIVTIYDVDHEDGQYFLTMELMEGQPLDAVLKRRGKLPPSTAAWVGQQAATGLAYAHERRIVHRDVKTANLFVTRERTIKIMDFGLAKVVEEVRRRASLIAGTPSYMAPEQLRGIEVDGRADLYALGVTLFELLTGALPFASGDPVYHHLNTPAPDPRERVPEVPEGLAALVGQLLAKRAEERPASTSEVATRLAAFSGS